MIDQAQAVALLNRAVEERGADFVAEQYSYVNDKGQPNCIVALALSYLGATSAQLIGVDGYNSNTKSISFRTDLIQKFDLSLGATQVFSKAQSLQDRAWSWGNVVSDTLAELPGAGA